MKPTDPFEEEKSDEDTTSPPIPLVVSSTFSHDSNSLAGKGIAFTGTDFAGVEKQGKPENESSCDQVISEARDPIGWPPLPQNLESPQQQRDDNAMNRPQMINRDQSGGTAISAITENSPEQSPTRRVHNRKASPSLLDTAVVVGGLPTPAFPKLEPVLSDKVLSVADLHSASPLEAEAETSILKAIEDKEDDPSTIGRGLFDAIPENATASYRVQSPSASLGGHRRVKTGMTSGRRGNKGDLESTLIGLTVAMRDMHEQSENTTVIPGDDERADDHGSDMINDANILFRRTHLRKGKSARHLEVTESEVSDDPVEVDVELGQNGESTNDESQGKKSQRGKRRFLCAKTMEKDWATLSDFMRPRRASIALRIKTLFLAFILPTFAVSALLFYLGNPKLGRKDASISWFLLFLIRHSILFMLAEAFELFFITFLALNTRWTVRVLGPFQSLCLVQSKGFPFVISMWGILGLLTLAGPNRFAKHWLFYQNLMPIFNENNPAGTITESRMNYAVLACAVVFGIVVSLKRVLLGLHFGRRTYVHFGDDVAKLVRKILLVGEVAALGRDLELGMGIECIQVRAAVLAFNVGPHDVKGCPEDDEETTNVSSGLSYSKIINDARRDRYTGSLTDSQRNEIMGLLESWEEPEADKKAMVGDASISAILQLRQALTLAMNDFPFSLAFGLADTREHCIESSQKVYKRLLLRQPEEGVLDFDTIALLATTDDGNIDREKMKELIRLFRPERDGTLTLVDFVKSVDAVYKRLRLLSASINNRRQIDNAAERIFNWIFYTIVAIVIVTVLGFDPLAMFLSLSSIIVAFAFMIGNASAKYFEGILFILMRRPYGIGDRIHVSPVDEDTNPNGSSTWYVENVDLFSTTVRFAITNEVATVSNGSLANSRVINAARSPKMLVYVQMKFGIDVPYQKVKLFRKTVEEFVKQRPRDWLSMCGFRATRVEHDLAFIEYVMVLQHRERWQNVIPMLNAKAEFSSFALEVAKKLDMPYRAPSLPVDLNMGNRDLVMGRMKDEITAEDNLEAQLEKDLKRSGSDRSIPDMSDVAALFAATSLKIAKK